MRTICFLDTYYDSVLRDNPPDPRMTRTQQLAALCFGTSDAYSKAFKQMGWNAYDIVVNDAPYWDHQKVMLHLMANDVDVVYCQDLCFLSPTDIQLLKNKGTKVIGQISSKWPGDGVIKNYDLLFSSFPHYVPRFNALGVRGEFLPIAFIEGVLDYVPVSNRDIDISFVGGLGSSSNGGYWDKGTYLFESIAKAFPNFQWWGYFIGNLSDYPNLRRAYRAPAWGIDQYRIYARSKIVVNRHGEVAEGYTNNMRCFEATGMGACLFTEYSKNLDFYFEDNKEVISYHDANELITNIKDMIYDWETGHNYCSLVGADGYFRTMRDHTYTKRLAEIEPIVRGLIK